ncbi:phage resistance protein [Micromonospora echinospora]|uniref:Phage resistance protein n=1 Tax=Micromonospora echinospora TaxID=1877 RepID=A0A1C4V613_MICEC|nr:phage resistance protein [Micromonospora echinospora]OZV83100.1 phage resistance protein [Micromonospora echinospora]SCE79251.1 hypothetical protein GA0070618_0968 [Micromonospora echinospora]
MTLLRDVIDIPTSVGDGDFVVRAAEGADLRRYVVTDQLRESFAESLRRIGHAVTTGRSQAVFLHGSFGSGKSHFMAVLREILQHNPAARELRGLAEPVLAADEWLTGRRMLTLTFHMLDARSVEQAILEGYLRQVTALHPDAPVPPVHRSDALLDDAARLRDRMGDEAFFAALRDGGSAPTAAGGGLAAIRARAQGWTPQTYADAAAEPPGSAGRDALVSALTSAFFTGAVRSAEFLDLDTGLAVITRHAKALGYDAMVLFLDELILWLSTRISDHTFVNTEGAKLNKLIESADATRPLPLISFVARQRNLEDFLGPQVGGTEREALAHVMRSVQGRFGEVALADTNLPEITEGRLLKPVDDEARAVVDRAFAAVRGNRAVWDTLLLGAQYGDAGIGSDAAAFRKLYPFSPALVATLVALSQALQRERTALKVMTELLVERRDTLRVNDLIGVAALFDPLVLRGELPDRPKLKQLFQAARALYLRKLRPLLLKVNNITEEQAAGHAQFALDDKLIKTVLLGALVPDVPALHNLTPGKLHALNFGTITSPIPGYEQQIVVNRLKQIAADAGELHLTDERDPIVTLTLNEVDYDQLLELVTDQEVFTTSARQQLLRELVSAEMGMVGTDGQLGELLVARDWRGRKHVVQVKFGNVRDSTSMPVEALVGDGSRDGWRIVVDYPFDPAGYGRNADLARIEELDQGAKVVFWLPLYLTDEAMGRVRQLAKINYLLGAGGHGERLNTLAADWSAADRQEGRLYLQQRQTRLRANLLSALREAYGLAGSGQGSDVQEDSIPILHTLAEGLQLGRPRGGSLTEAFGNLTRELFAWSYPGKPAMPEDEKPVTRAELAKILSYARQAAADPTRGVSVASPADQRTLRRVCNPLRLGELVDNHRYVLNRTTCRWTGHLHQAAAAEGHTERFPVRVLRRLVDEPAAFGFDRELENLIIAVFALDQQLAWYEHGGKVEINTLAAIHDNLELRPPPMPDEREWTDAVRRSQELLGIVLPAWRTPANLGPLAATLRSAARARRDEVTRLRQELTARAALLGLDPAAPSGRLATVRRAADLLVDLAGEADDVVLVRLVARADLGDVDDRAVGGLIAQAKEIGDALARPQQWSLLGAIDARSAHDERARTIIDRLRDAAGHQQHGTDLTAALQAAEAAAADLLAAGRQERPQPTPPQPTPGDPSSRPGPAAPQPATSPTGSPPTPGSTDSQPTPHPAAPQSTHRPADAPAAAGVPRGRRRVTDQATWEKVAAEIAAEVAAGRSVTLSWEVE